MQNVCVLSLWASEALIVITNNICYVESLLCVQYCGLHVLSYLTLMAGIQGQLLFYPFSREGDGGLHCPLACFVSDRAEIQIQSFLIATFYDAVFPFETASMWLSGHLGPSAEPSSFPYVTWIFCHQLSGPKAPDMEGANESVSEAYLL